MNALATAAPVWPHTEPISVNKAASRLPWRKNDAREWIHANVPVRRGPGNRRFVLWGEVVQALRSCEQLNDATVHDLSAYRQKAKPRRRTAKSLSRGHQWLND